MHITGQCYQGTDFSRYVKETSIAEIRSNMVMKDTKFFRIKENEKPRIPTSFHHTNKRKCHQFKPCSSNSKLWS